jgi:hypothetical protein
MGSFRTLYFAIDHRASRKEPPDGESVIGKGATLSRLLRQDDINLPTMGIETDKASPRQERRVAAWIYVVINPVVEALGRAWVPGERQPDLEVDYEAVRITRTS